MIDKDLNDLIGLIYEAALQPQLWPQVLEQVANITPCAVATLYSHDTSTRTSVIHESFGLDPNFLQDYFDRWAAANPVIDAMTLLDPGEVAGLAPLIDYEAFTRHPFFQEWGRPQNYVDCINIMLERSPTRVASVSLIRNAQQGVADELSIERLGVLAPHFLRSIRMGRVFEQTTIKEGTLTSVLDMLSSAVFLVDRHGVIAHANARASALFGNGLTIGMIKAAAAAIGVLSSSTSVRTATPNRSSTGSEAPFDGTYLIDLNGTERLICHGIPLVLTPHHREHTAGSTLLVVQNATSTNTAVRAAARTFGLTKREHDVLFGLVEGGGITPTADMLGLSKQTVKTHVRSIFMKTQTHRQSDLVKLVSELMSPFREASTP